MRLVIGLQTDKHRRFGRTIELLEVDAYRAVKTEQIRPDGFTGRVGHAHPAETQVVAQRAIDQKISKCVQSAVQQRNRCPATERGTYALSQPHTRMEQGTLDARGVFHANHYAGEQTFKYTRRRKIIGGPDFLEVDVHRGRRLRAVHYIAARQPLRIAKDILANPGHRHIGQHFFVFR